MKFRTLFTIAWTLAALLTGVSAQPQGNGSLPGRGNPCIGLPSQAALKIALTSARNQSNGGFNLDMWGTVVNRDGVVCAVAFTGADRGSQWPGSRLISAQKANTANAFSLKALVLSTANLYSAVQPGGSLFGLQASNPVDTGVAYGGNPEDYGQPDDPMVGQRIGGVNVFGGGLALYNSKLRADRRARRQRRFLLRRSQHRLEDTQQPGSRLSSRRCQRRRQPSRQYRL